MKISDLITQLSKTDQNAKVMIAIADENPTSRTEPDVYRISYLERYGNDVIFLKAFRDRE